MLKTPLGSLVIGMAAALCAVATAGADVTFTGHTDNVVAVAFSPDGLKVLTGSKDKLAKLWNPETGAEALTFTGHSDWVNSVAFSPDGTQVLTGSGDSTAKLWPVYGGAATKTFSGHIYGVYSVAFSPDGTKVLTGAGDGTAKLWDAATGDNLKTFTGHTDEIHGVAYSPDGTQVLTASHDKTAKLWDVATGLVVRTFTGHTDYVLAVAFSPDGTKVLTGSTDHTAKLWNRSTGALIRTLTGHANEVPSVAFSADGARMLTSGGYFDDSVKLWTVSTGALIGTLTGHSTGVWSAVFSPDGTQVLSGGGDKKAMLQTIPPSATGTIVINNNLSATPSPQVTLALTWSGGWGTGVVRMRFSDNGSTWTAWEPLLSTRPYTLPTGDGYKTVRVQFRDSDGNNSAVFSDYIMLDTTLPTGGIIINGGALSTPVQLVSLGLNWADGAGSGAARMRFSDNGATWTPWETLKATRAYTLPLPNGYHTVRVQFRDGAGNVSAAYNDYIKLAMP